MIALAASLAASSSSKRPTTVAPEPVMRASPQTVSPARRSFAASTDGASRIAGASRSFRPAATAAIHSTHVAILRGRTSSIDIARPARRDLARREVGEDARRLEPFSRIDEHGVDHGQIERRPQDLAASAHHSRALRKTDRDVGARLLRRLDDGIGLWRQPVQPGEQPERRRRVGRATAEACSDREMLHQVEGAEPQACDAPRESPCGAQHQIGIRYSGVFGELALDLERERMSRRETQLVADRRESDEALELVIAIGPLARDGERQIDLRRSEFDERSRVLIRAVLIRRRPSSKPSSAGFARRPQPAWMSSS